MAWTSRYPTVFTRASDRKQLGFMGRPEMLFKLGWDQAWVPLKLTLRSQAFLDHLGPQPNAATMAAVIHSLLNDAEYRMRSQIGVALGRSLLNSAADAQHLHNLEQGPELFKVVEKAGNPFRRGTTMHSLAEARRTSATTVFAPYTRYLNTARQLTLNLLDDLTKAQKAQTLAIIVRGFEKNLAPRKIANDVANAIGLNSRWITAVENFRASLANTPITEKMLEKRVATYANTLLKKRGEMVARTEMMRAMNAGRFEFWQDRASSGELSSDNVVKMWIIAPGACPDCETTADINAAGVPDMVEGLDTPFDTPFGKVLYPPLHPHCRCTVNYVLKGGGDVRTGTGAGGDGLGDVTDAEMARVMQ